MISNKRSPIRFAAATVRMTYILAHYIGRTSKMHGQARINTQSRRFSVLFFWQFSLSRNDLRALNAIIAGHGNSERTTANRSGLYERWCSVIRYANPRFRLSPRAIIARARAHGYRAGIIRARGRHLHNYRHTITKRARFLGVRSM